MKKNLLKITMFGAVITAFSLAGCKKDNDGSGPGTVDPGDRWITVAGALMQTTAGDGNGGTMVYSVSRENAKDPSVSIDVFNNGMHVKSNRTARLQSSEDGNNLFNIQYTGADGGVFNKYTVLGGNQFPEADVAVNTADYVGTSPRWAKLFDGDKTGIAVNVSTPANVSVDGEYQYTRGTATVLALDLQNVLISGVQSYEIPLSAEEEVQGYHIWRLDAPFLNKAGDKLMIGTWMRKWIPGTTTADAADAPRLGTKTVVVDYPSLLNPTIITSTVATGDNSGYRSPMSYVGTDGNIYQATHREVAGTGGSHILRINQNNEYDNSYVFSLDAALGITDSYIYTWRYAGNGIGYVLYRDGASDTGADHIARVDLNARTAARVAIPGNPTLTFNQYQGITIHGEEVYIAVAPVGQDGNIYIFNSRTGEVTQGAKLINQTGNQYIGIY